MDLRARQLISYLVRNVLVDPDLKVDENTRLVSTGLVDSFALVEVLNELEKITRRKIPSGRVSPQDLETVKQMLHTAERVGEPRED